MLHGRTLHDEWTIARAHAVTCAHQEKEAWTGNEKLSLR